MADEEEKNPPDQQRPPLPFQNIGQHKCAEVDALQPTPERKAKTGEKS